MVIFRSKLSIFKLYNCLVIYHSEARIFGLHQRFGQDLQVIAIVSGNSGLF